MRYGVIGGGILGLTAALRLAQRGHDVTVIEQGPVPGGLASSFEVVPGIWLERFYHHLFRSDRAAIALIGELGLSDRLYWHRPVTTVLVGDQPHQLDSPLSLLRFGPLSIRARVRLAAALAYLKLLPSPDRLQASEADAWMARAAGEEAHALIWRPLLQGKFGSHFERVAMAWLWARLHDRTTELGYLRGGFHQLYLALGEAVTAAGGSMRLGMAVSGISRGPGGLELTIAGAGEHLVVDRVISTLPPAVTAHLAGLGPATAPVYPPLSAQCVVVALDRPVTGIYWIGSTSTSDPFVAIVEHTALRPSSEYGGQVLVYLGAYRDPADERLSWSTDQLLASALDQLHRLNPQIGRSSVRAAWSFVAPNAQPIVHAGYRQTIPPFAHSMPGLYNASMFHVFPHDRGQNYSIELAHALVDALDDGG